MYVNIDGSQVVDCFIFVVEDGIGGFFLVINFDIIIDVVCVISIDDILSVEVFQFYFNLINGQVNLCWNEVIVLDYNFCVFNVQGQVLQ